MRIAFYESKVPIDLNKLLEGYAVVIRNVHRTAGSDLCSIYSAEISEDDLENPDSTWGIIGYMQHDNESRKMLLYDNASWEIITGNFF